MSTINSFYMDTMNEEFGYFATWDPGTHLAVGDVGLMTGNEFKRWTSLDEKKIPYKKLKDPTPSQKDYQTEGSVTVRAKLQGEPELPGSTLKIAEAGINVKFSKQAAFVFKAVNAYNDTIADLDALGTEILERYDMGKGLWKKEWVVITELVRAESGTVIISKSQNGCIDLRAKVGIGLESLNIANGEAGLNVATKRDISVQVIADKGMTPLFKIAGLSHPILGIFGYPTFKPKRGAKLETSEFKLQEVSRYKPTSDF